jgi:hypothetical protein
METLEEKMDRLELIKFNLKYSEEYMVNISKSDVEWLIHEVEGWKKDSEMYQEYLNREKNLYFFANEKAKRYEKALKEVRDKHYNDKTGDIAKEALKS